MLFLKKLYLTSRNEDTSKLVESGSPSLVDGDVVEHGALDGDHCIGDQCIGHEKRA